MTCQKCKTLLMAVLFDGEIEVGWVCKCEVIIEVTSHGYDYGSQVYMAADYKQFPAAYKKLVEIEGR